MKALLTIQPIHLYQHTLLHFMSSHFIPTHFTSFDVVSLYFTQFHFISFHSTLLHFISYHFISLQFTWIHINLTSYLFTSFLLKLHHFPPVEFCSTGLRFNWLYYASFGLTLLHFSSHHFTSLTPPINSQAHLTSCGTTFCVLAESVQRSLSAVIEQIKNGVDAETLMRVYWSEKEKGGGNGKRIRQGRHSGDTSASQSLSPSQSSSVPANSASSLFEEKYQSKSKPVGRRGRRRAYAQHRATATNELYTQVRTHLIPYPSTHSLSHSFTSFLYEWAPEWMRW